VLVIYIQYTQGRAQYWGGKTFPQAQSSNPETFVVVVVVVDGYVRQQSR